METHRDIFADRRKNTGANTSKGENSEITTFVKDRRNPHNTFNKQTWYLSVNYTKHGLIY